MLAAGCGARAHVAAPRTVTVAASPRAVARAEASFRAAVQGIVAPGAPGPQVPVLCNPDSTGAGAFDCQMSWPCFNGGSGYANGTVTAAGAVKLENATCS